MLNGYIRENPKAVIGGGESEKLLEKRGKGVQALGLAKNLGAAPAIPRNPADIALLYDESDNVYDVLEQANKLREKGKSVIVSKTRVPAVKTYAYTDGDLQEVKE